MAATPARAETLESALVKAYRNNPSLNSQRASVRVTDENVPQALAGYRPKVSLSASGGEQTLSSTSKSTSTGSPIYTTLSGSNSPFSTGVTATQTLFNGFQTANRTRAAESQVLAARATLRNTEQSVLLDAATAYMNLLRDTAIVELQKSNVEVLQEQLRQTRDRFNVGEVTRTDVAQSEVELGQRPLAAAHGRIQLHDVGGRLPQGDRRRARPAIAGHAGGSLLAAHAAGGGRGRHFLQSVGGRRRVQCRRGAVAGEGRRRRALSQPLGAGQFHAELVEHVQPQRDE